MASLTTFAAREKYDGPTLVLPDGTKAPNLFKLGYAIGGRGGTPRKRIAERVGFAPELVERLAWVSEPIADPSLRFDGTPGAIREARDGGLRWERIAARTGLSVSTVRARYAEASGKVSETTYAGRGRRFAETLRGPLDADSAKPYVGTVKSVRRSGLRGDANVARVAGERLASASDAPAKAKAPARRASRATA